MWPKISCRNRIDNIFVTCTEHPHNYIMIVFNQNAFVTAAIVTRAKSLDIGFEMFTKHPYVHYAPFPLKSVQKSFS